MLTLYIHVNKFTHTSLMSKKTIPFIFIIFGIILAFWAWPLMPTTMATHWGISGEVNGYSSKAVGLLIMPFISTIMFIAFSFLPKLEPYRKNFAEFESYYDNFMIIIFGFLFYIFCLTIAWNLGVSFNLIQYMSPGLSLLFFYTALLLRQTKRNWFVGIRTPWTMQSPEVWRQTHDLGAKLFTLVAVLALLGTLLPSLAFYLFFVPLVASIIYIYIFSYIQYTKLKKANKAKR